MSTPTKIDIPVYEDIVKRMGENAVDLKVDVNKVLEGKASTNGTWTMESFFGAESRFALELTKYSEHVINKVVPTLMDTKDEFIEIDREAKCVISS